MPQLNPGGKYVYGWSRVNSDMKLCLPPELVKEYGLNDTEDIVILMSSSKTSGGFCVTSMKKIRKSAISHIIDRKPILKEKNKQYFIITYKNRVYVSVQFENNIVKLSSNILKKFDVNVGDNLLLVRGSNIAFDCLLKGPLVEMAEKSEKMIVQY